jgi:site-specific DNA recombinase
MRYFIYCRKSSEAEDRQVASIESQLTTLVRTFSEKSDIQIIRVYEEAFSAKAPGRPIFGEMIAEIEKGNADGIIAWAPDRLARNSVDGGRIIYLLDTGAIKDLKFATYTFENGSQGKFMLQIMFGQSKYYSDALSENVKRGNRTKLEKGWRPNHAPLGYRNDPVSRTIIKDPERFHLIRRMFEEVLAGTPVSRVRKMANEEWNFRTPVRKRIGGKPITLGWMYKVLRNPFYAGLIPWAGKMYPGKHEPMITMDEFERVQAIIHKRGKANPKVKEFAFTGMIRCGECGMLVTAEEKVNRFGSRYVYYHCTKRRSDYRCSQRCIRVEELERQIEAFLSTLHMPERIHAWALRQLDEQLRDTTSLQAAQRASMEKSLSDTERAIANLTTLRVHEHISQDEFVTERQKLEMERLRLMQLLASNTGDTFEPVRALVSFSNRALECFRAGDLRTKRLILNAVGSNLLLKDRTLNVEAKKPLRRIANISNPTQLRAAVENIRTLHVARDIEFMTMIDNIRALDAVLGNRSAGAAHRAA